MEYQEAHHRILRPISCYKKSSVRWEFKEKTKLVNSSSNDFGEEPTLSSKIALLGTFGYKKDQAYEKQSKLINRKNFDKQ